jgi:gamma-glutamylcyclotransferase
VSDWYFAYGSNMNPARVKARGIAYQQLRPGLLGNHQLSFNKRATGKSGVAYANIDYAKGRVVEGVLYQLRFAKDIELMDPFEGHPVRYRREVMPIETGQGDELAWVYLANPAVIASKLLPERAYLNHLLAGKAWYSDDYYQWLSSHDCIESGVSEVSVNGLINNA